jgi:cation:H+ antiporter
MTSEIIAASLRQLVIGLVILLAAAQMLVWGASGIAAAIGVSDLIIGLTVVALGTSLPELAAAIAAVLRNEHDIAVGNILGSNLFNLLAVLPLPGLLAPGLLPEGILSRDFPVMLGLTLLVLVLARGFSGAGAISRWEGGALLGIFLVYQVLLIHSAMA